MSKKISIEYLFLLIWFPVFFIFLVSPWVLHGYDESGYYNSVIFCFVLFVSSFLTKKVLGNNDVDTSENSKAAIEGLERFGKLSLIFFGIGVVGVALHSYDKLVIRGYEYFNCTFPRESWLLGKDRLQGIMSLPSKLGHVFSYFLLVPVMFQRENKKKDLLFALVSVVLFILYSYLMTSRSSLIYFVITVFMGLFFLFKNKAISGKSLLQRYGLISTLLLSFTFFTFYQKISCVDHVPITEFVEGVRLEHGVNVAPTGGNALRNFFRLPEEFFVQPTKVSYIANAVLVYNNTGFNNFNMSYKNVKEPSGFYILRPILGVLYRLNILSYRIDLSRIRGAYGRGFLNLPGAFYVSFGLKGMLFFGLLLGALLGALSIFIEKVRFQFLVPLFAFMFTVVAIAPLADGLALMSAPFILFSTVVFTFTYFVKDGLQKGGVRFLAKRGVDIILATFFLLVSFPIIFLLSLLIFIEDRGRAFYYSKRIGRNGEIFLMPKLRTMKLDTPQVATHLLSNPDEYLLKVGKIIRKFSLDELPQFFSVLVGDMSLVGPRPALYNQDDLIALRKEKGIDSLSPGITGWAQINGRDEIPIPAKVDLDFYYFQNQGLFFDLKIIFLTFLQMIVPHGVSH